MTYSPKHMLVTGGAGFIGANFIHYMLHRYPDLYITNVDKLTYAACLDNLSTVTKFQNYNFIEGDICNQAHMEEILWDKNIDTLVHFAAESHVDRSITNPHAFIQTNLVGTYILLEAARNIFIKKGHRNESTARFHHISTDEVYGSLNHDDPSFTEQTAYSPKSPYSASKAGSDHLVRAYQNTYCLPITLSNCSNNYGPYQHDEKFIPTIIRGCLENKAIPIYKDGRNVRDWLYVMDHCSAIDLIIRQGEIGQSYNIGGNEEYTNLDLAKLILKMMAKTLRKDHKYFLELITFIQDRPGHDYRYAINSEKITTNLGWKKQYNLEMGLTKTISWYLNRGVKI